MQEKAPTKFETALISGASSGIGFELARIFAKEGYNLLLVARDKKKLTEIAIQIRSDFKVSVGVIGMDLAHPQAGVELYNLVKKNNQKVSILVNNAGVGAFSKHIERDVQHELAMIDLNVHTVVSLSRLFGAEMAANQGGRILNVASIAGFFPGPHMAVYHATKAFIISYSQALAKELEQSGVTVSCLCPGYVQTQFASRAAMPPEMAPKRAMEPDIVAKAGYNGLMQKKLLIVPGFKNKVIVFAIKYLPKNITLKLMTHVNKNKPQ